jgi:hypothetical protein
MSAGIDKVVIPAHRGGDDEKPRITRNAREALDPSVVLAWLVSGHDRGHADGQQRYNDNR